MGIREQLTRKPTTAAGAAVLMVVVAAGIMAKTWWPERKPDLNQAFYTVDEGQSWFADSMYRVAPFDHNGKPAVVAEIYSYDDGKKQFCAYLARFTSDAKRQLEAALADAQKRGEQPGSVGLYHDRGFMNRGTEVKLPGPNNPWIPYTDSRAQQVFSIHSPDGTPVDQVFVY